MPKVFRAGAHRTAIKRIEPKRSSPRARGYDSRWDAYSERYRKAHPFCRFCEERGLLTLIVEGNTGVVDHKRPIVDGGAMWDPANHMPLCHACHNGLKRRLEDHARSTGQLDQIARWCDDPESRPKFRGQI